MDVKTKEVTQKLLNSIRDGAALLHIAGICTNMYGYWLLEGIPADSLEPLVTFLIRMNELNVVGYELTDDQLKLELYKAKEGLQQNSGLTVHTAIAQLIQLLQPIVEKD